MTNNPQPIGACVIVRDGNNILLGKRKNAYKAGKYGLPGGRIEGNEEAEQAAIRELLEETNLTAKKMTYLGVVKEWQETKNFIHFVFLCQSWTGKLKVMEPNKCEAWEWFDASNIPKNVLAGHAAGIGLLVDERILVELL